MLLQNVQMLRRIARRNRFRCTFDIVLSCLSLFITSKAAISALASRRYHSFEGVNVSLAE